MLKRTLFTVLAVVFVSLLSPVLSIAANEYITYAQLNDTDYPALSQDANNPTEIWEDNILEFGFVDSFAASTAKYTLKDGKTVLPFHASVNPGGTFLQGVLGGNFPQNAIGKTLTLTIDVRGTQSNYYIKVKSIELWEDPIKAADKIVDAYVLKNGLSVPLSTKKSKPTEVSYADTIVFELSPSLANSTIGVNYIGLINGVLASESTSETAEFKLNSATSLQFRIWWE